MPHTVDNESYQSSSELKINCLKITGSSVVRLIFRGDSEFGSRKKIVSPKIWDLSFHLSYLRAESVDGAPRTRVTNSLDEVYPPIITYIWLIVNFVWRLTCGLGSVASK